MVIHRVELENRADVHRHLADIGGQNREVIARQPLQSHALIVRSWCPAVFPSESRKWQRRNHP